MPITKPINSKGNLKQKTQGDMPQYPSRLVTNKYTAVSTASQTAVTLTFAVDQSSKDNFFLVVDGKLLTETGDFSFSNIQANNTSSQISLVTPLDAGVNIQAWYLGTIQANYSLSSLTAQVNNINIANNNGSEGAGTTTLTSSSNPVQLTTLTAARTYVLPTTGISVGYPITIINNGDFALTVQASGGQTVAIVNIGMIHIVSNVNTPTLKTDWTVRYIKSKTTTNTTFSFNGGGGTSGSVAVITERINNFVNIYCPAAVATTGTGSTVLTSNTAIVSHFRPVNTTALPYNTTRNNATQGTTPGVFYVNTDGTLQVVRDGNNQAFTNAASGGMQQDFHGMYYLAL
jgi:hypothetical protein